MSDTKLTNLIVNLLTREELHRADFTDHGDELFVQSDHAGVSVGGVGVDGLDTTNITNCITYIPQDIKLELTDGVLTLKAGSKYYYPDGTNTFNNNTTTTDLTLGPVGTYTGQSMVYLVVDGSALTQALENISGTTAPTRGAWYDTNTNYIKYYSDGSDTGIRYSFPIALATRTNGNWTSIDQVFNGFGYMGSTIFALPGVKGLIPNGRNEDGTLKNTEFVSTNVVVRTFSTPTLKYIGFNGTYIGLSDVQISGYDKLTNTNYSVDERWDFCLVGIVNNSKGIFSTKQPFAATDYNDTEYMAHQAMPSGRYIDLTLGASGSTYTAPTDGYIILLKKGDYQQYVTIDIGYDKVYADYAYNDQVVGLRISVKKGQSFSVWYSTTKETQRFAFMYAQGSK